MRGKESDKTLIDTLKTIFSKAFEMFAEYFLMQLELLQHYLVDSTHEICI